MGPNIVKQKGEIIYMKKNIAIICIIILILSTINPLAFASNGPSEADLIAIGSGIEYPQETEYLDKYYYGTVQAPGRHSVYCYGSADMLGSKYTVADGEYVEILARRGQMLCVIIISQNKARWIREDNIMTSTDYIETSGTTIPNLGVRPSEGDLKAIQSQIEYPKNNEFWDDYGYGTVTDRRGDSVYCYGSADRLGSKYVISVGENVVVLANRGDMYCVIIPSIEKARWINKANVELSSESVDSDSPANSNNDDMSTTQPADLLAGTIPEAVLKARSGVVHVYLLFYDEQGSLIALNSGAGIVTPGAVFRDESFPESWNCVLTSFSCVDITRMQYSYASYRIVVIADGNVYNVKEVGGLPEINKELALLFMEDYIPNRNFIGLTQKKLLREGEAVYALGFPEPSNQYAPEYESFENEEIIRNGIVLDLNYDESGVSYIHSNNGTQRNLIGGALVNSEGHLVGMISCYGGKDETLAITCDDIADLLETANMPLAYGNIEGLELDNNY